MTHSSGTLMGYVDTLLVCLLVFNVNLNIVMAVIILNDVF